MSHELAALEGSTEHTDDRGRRAFLVGVGSATLAGLAAFKKAHGMNDETHAAMSAAAMDPGANPVPSQQAAAVPIRKYQKVAARDGVKVYPALHHGKGQVDVQFFFRTGRTTGAAEPALLMTYTIPPGASEGVHTHRLGDPLAGSFDEFYYIVSGSGEMQIDDEAVPVVAGDCVFTPIGVAHGIENTAKQGDLLLHLVAMRRT